MRTVFDNVKLGKIEIDKNKIFEFIPLEIRQILAAMIEHDPRRRIEASQLVSRLAKLTRGWKNKVCKDFLKSIRKKNSLFSASQNDRKLFAEFPLGNATDIVNSYRDNSGRRDGHVKIDEVLWARERPMMAGEDTGRRELIGENVGRQLSPIPMKKKVKRRKVVTSQTFASNVFAEFRGKKGRLEWQRRRRPSGLIEDGLGGPGLTQDCV